MQVLTRASEVPSVPRTRWKRGTAAAAIVAAVLSVAGCGSAPIAAPAANASVTPAAPGAQAPSSCPAWLAAQQRGEGRLYRVDAASSQVRIHVFRAGRLAKVGHNHVLGVERLGGQVFLPTDGITGAGVELDFRLDEVGIDKPEWRAGLGTEFASVPTASDVAGTRTNMLRAIDGERFPVISMRSTGVAGAFPVLAVKLAVQWHGQVREIDVPVRVVRPSGEATLRAQGALVLRQSEFGITPFSVFGGLLAIQDELTVDVDVAARPAVACD
jgi:hypothetical protein